jgi:NTP pyrophosphatase (non-canonical NTP hydrolase)
MPMSLGLNKLCKEAHKNSVSKGWWEEERQLPEILALIHSEVSEALEEYRYGKGVGEIYFNDYSPDKPEGIPIELADILIRVFDLCGKHNINLKRAVKMKMEYNKQRPYKHGKVL